MMLLDDELASILKNRSDPVNVPVVPQVKEHDDREVLCAGSSGGTIPGDIHSQRMQSSNDMACIASSFADASLEKKE